MSPDPGASAFARFLAVGGASTALHYLVLVLLVEGLTAPAVVAATAGYLAGGALNYGLNRRWTFRSRRQHRAALPRFVGMFLAGLVLNALTVHLATAGAGWHYVVAQVLATGLVLVCNFLLLRHWVFPGTP